MSSQCAPLVGAVVKAKSPLSLTKTITMFFVNQDF